MQTDIETMRRVDWPGVEQEVVQKLRLLRAMVAKLEPNALNDKIAEDLFLPALKKLGEFCTMVEIDDDIPAGADPGGRPPIRHHKPGGRTSPVKSN